MPSLIDATEDRVSAAQAARECGLSHPSFTRHVLSGHIAAERIGDRIFVRRADLEAWKAQRAAKQQRTA